MTIGRESTPALALAFWRIAVGALVFMPVGMALAHRSSPAFLGVAAVFALLALAAEKALSHFAARCARSLATPTGIAVLAFLVWSWVSVAWSAFPVVSVRALGEFWLSIAFAFVLANALPGRAPRVAIWLLALATAAAAIMMMVELRTGMAIRHALHIRANTFIFNRPMLTLMVLLPGLVAFLLRRGPAGILLAAGLSGLIAVALLESESGAAVLGFGAAVAVFGLACLSPRLVTWAAVLAFVAVMAAAPFLGPIGNRYFPASGKVGQINDHPRDRIEIWLSFDDAIQQSPWLGAGFGASAVMDKMPVAAQVAPQNRLLLGVGHPHNAAIQIWVELGIVGAAITLMIAVQVLRSLSTKRRLAAAAALSLLAGATAVALVGHGAWQGWWAAVLGAAIIWQRIIDAHARPEEAT